jgi:nicotinamidase-related amidase
MPAVQAALPGVVSLERHNMNVWEDEAARSAIVKTGRRRLIVSGLLMEACVTFSVLSAIAAGFEVYVVGDACGGLTSASTHGGGYGIGLAYARAMIHPA